MKTILQNDKIQRVSDREAERLVERGAQYVPKKRWKALRDADKPTPAPEVK